MKPRGFLACVIGYQAPDGEFLGSRTIFVPGPSRPSRWLNVPAPWGVLRFEYWATNWRGEAIYR